MRTKAQSRPKKIKTPYEIYCNVLRAWAAEAPADMRDEPAREKILDAMLRLFERLEASGLRPALAAQPVNWATIKKYHGPLLHALCWQCLVLNITMPKSMAPFVPHLLSLVVLRWIPIWLRDNTPGQARLMAVIDRDLGCIHAAAQQIGFSS